MADGRAEARVLVIDLRRIRAAGETPEAAEKEAKQLGASRLVLIDAAGRREVQL